MKNVTLQLTIPIASKVHDQYRGIAFDGSHFYLTAETKHIAKFNDKFEECDSIDTYRPYTYITYDTFNKCFYATSCDPSKIYILNHNCIEIDCLNISSYNKAPITGISHNCANREIMIANQTQIFSVKDCSDALALPPCKDIISCMTSISPYYITLSQKNCSLQLDVMNHSCPTALPFKTYTLTLPKGYLSKSLIFNPIKSLHCNSNIFYLLTTKNHFYTHIMQLEICDNLEISKCNYTFDAPSVAESCCTTSTPCSSTPSSTQFPPCSSTHNYVDSPQHPAASHCNKSSACPNVPTCTRNPLFPVPAHRHDAPPCSKSLSCHDAPPCSKSLSCHDAPPCPKALSCHDAPPCPKALSCHDAPPCPKALSCHDAPPCPPPLCPHVCLDFAQSCSALIESIALEQVALSHILNAEGEKLQKILSCSNDFNEIMTVNDSIASTIAHVTNLEIVLYNKIAALQKICDDNPDLICTNSCSNNSACDCPTTCGNNSTCDEPDNHSVTLPDNYQPINKKGKPKSI